MQSRRIVPSRRELLAAPRAAAIALAFCLSAIASAGACSGEEPPIGDPGPPRLIPPGDPDHAELEQPEADAECADTADCEISCVWSCTPPPTGPFTCPVNPVPMPARVDGAVCTCEAGLCAWYADPP